MTRLSINPETLVPTTTTRGERFSRITTLADGGYIIVWQGPNDSTKPDQSFFQRYDAAGNTVGGETLINTAPVTGGHGYPDVAALDTGGFVVVWQGAVDGDDSGIMMKVYDAEGHVVTASRVNLATEHGQYFPAVSGLPGGGFVVTWFGERTTGTFYPSDVYQRTFDSSGTAETGDVVVHPNSAYSDVTTLGDGSYILTWEDPGMAVQHFSANGTALGPVFSANTTMDNGPAFPQVTALSDGGYVVAWVYYRNSQLLGYSFQRFDANDHKVGHEISLTPHDYYTLTRPAMAELSDGSLAVAAAMTNDDGTQGVFVQCYDSHGDLLGAPILVAETSDEGFTPHMTALADGGFVVTWTAYSEATGYETYQRAFTHSGDGSGDDLVYGTSANDVLDGGAGNDILVGGTGNDIMTGGVGNDTYHVDTTGDVVVEHAGEGTDTVITALGYILGENLENLTLTGALNRNGYGNELDNVIVGNRGNNGLKGFDGNDSLDGRQGADIMAGGNGDDAYYVDNTGDVVMEASNQGTDTVYSALSNYTLGKNVENLTLLELKYFGGNATGNTLANTITGNSGNNVLDGGAGADTLIGGLGNDTYIIDASDVIVEKPGEGIDTIQTSSSYILAANFENLILTGTINRNGYGNELDNVITGNSGNNGLKGFAGNDTLDGGDGNDIIDGGTGTDIMTGGLGDDIYYVDTSTDVVIEAYSQGTDTVYSTASSYVLGHNVETLILTGSGNLNGTGDSLANTIIGTNGNNILDGGAGADTLTGGLGNDTYVIDNAGDIVVEKAGEGLDTVQTASSYILGANIENLTLTGTFNRIAYGNELDNVITGNSGNNDLKGYSGNDTLDGGAGSDTLTGGLGADVFLFTAASGADTIADFKATDNDTINVNAYTHGTAHAGYITQSGGDVLITLAGGNVITVTSALVADVSAHMVW